MNYSYKIQPNYCEVTLCNFDPIKNYFLFSPLYAKTNRSILVPIEYLQCVEGGATKCMYGTTLKLLYRHWITDKLDNREPSAEETQILNHLLALLPHCNVDLYPRTLSACLERDHEFLEFFGDPDNQALIFNSSTGRRPQSYNIGLTVPQKLKTHCSFKLTQNFYLFFSFYLSFSISLFVFYISFFFATIED